MKSFADKALIRALGIASLLLSSRLTHAGWTGSMNGTGFGSANVSVTNAFKTAVAKVSSTATNGPTSSIIPAAGYTFCAPLPAGASPNTVAQIKGGAGYVWTANTKGNNGDGTDNYEIEQRVIVRPGDCPSLNMESIMPPGAFDSSTGIGSITVKAKGNAGTALLLRGFEVPPGTVIPVDDLNTANNETADFLKSHGVLKFENLMVGPFKYGYDGECDLIVFFQLDNPDLDNFIVTTDGLAKSNPIVVTCPVVPPVECGQPFDYPDVTVTGGCGNVEATYSPAVSLLKLGDNTVTVTATVTTADGKKDTGTCTFNVTLTDTHAPSITDCPDNIKVGTPLNATQCGRTVSWTEPTAADTCGIVSFTSDHHPGDFFPVGTTTVTYTATDKAGNITPCSFTVTVEDKTPPVPNAASLADVTSPSCNGPVTTLTPPTATDNCPGNITVTTSTILPITQSTVVTWTFTDAAGNSTTANQNVIIAGYTFVGFYSPVSGLGGQCPDIVKTVNGGSTVPIKFDFKCGSTFVTSGPKPRVVVQRLNNCTSVLEETFFADYQPDWHVNWDTSKEKKGLYKINVYLPGQPLPPVATPYYVYINLK